VPVLAEYRDGMTRCTEEGWKDQESCDFSKKSAFADRCQFFVSDDNSLNLCWSIEAEEAARDRL
jgi:hypothetical protein